MEVRLPAVLYRHYGQHLIVWLWARGFDDSRIAHGKNLGQGRATFRLSDLAAAANRSVSTVRRWLAGARDKGLIWRFQCAGDVCRLWYCSLERVAAHAGVEHLGAVAWIEIVDLKNLENLRICATEITAQGLQRQSLWNAKEAAKKNLGIKEPRIETPDRLFSPCDHLARVVERVGRFLFVSEGFIPYGASQELIAHCRGVSPRTVSRHLSNAHRLQASPVRGYRSEVDPCWKVQLAQRVRRSFCVEALKNSRLQELHDDGQRFIRGPNNRWFYLRTNVYWFDWQLSRQRYRRERLKEILEVPKECKLLQKFVPEERWVKWHRENCGLIRIPYRSKT